MDSVSGRPVVIAIMVLLACASCSPDDTPSLRDAIRPSHESIAQQQTKEHAALMTAIAEARAKEELGDPYTLTDAQRGTSVGQIASRRPLAKGDLLVLGNDLWEVVSVRVLTSGTPTLYRVTGFQAAVSFKMHLPAE